VSGYCDRTNCTNVHCKCNCALCLHRVLLLIVLQISRHSLLWHSIVFLSLSIPGISRRRWYLFPLSTMSTNGVLDNIPSSSSLPYGLNIPNSLGKRQSNIEDHGFITSSMSRLELPKYYSDAWISLGFSYFIQTEDRFQNPENDNIKNILLEVSKNTILIKNEKINSSKESIISAAPTSL